MYRIEFILNVYDNLKYCAYVCYCFWLFEVNLIVKILPCT